LLGCGCPLGPAIGLMDGMRISTDVAPNWHPELLTPRFSRWLEDDLAFVSARNAIQNIISRAALHRRWWLNDPDCLLVRDRDTRLTEAEVQTLASVIGLSGGMFLVSDDMSQLNPARHRYISTLLPVLNVRPCVPGWLNERVPNLITLPLSNAAGNWLVVGLFNWDDAPRALTVDWAELNLEAGAYWCADFWHGTIERVETSAPLATGLLPPHGVRLLALRFIGRGEAFGREDFEFSEAALPNASPLRAMPTIPMLVASTFHFSQGGEIAAWEFDGQHLRFTVELGRVATGTVHLALPTAPHAVNVDGQALSAERTPLGLYALTFTVHRSATVQISF
jgi:alpha-galactosidase